jgi:hypothetical protein
VVVAVVDVSLQISGQMTDEDVTGVVGAHRHVAGLTFCASGQVVVVVGVLLPGDSVARHREGRVRRAAGGVWVLRGDVELSVGPRDT